MSSSECYKCGKKGHFARECTEGGFESGRGGGFGRGGRGVGRGGSRGGARGGRGGGRGRGDSCYKCNRAGHFAKDCREEQDRCYKCNQLGHIAKDCAAEINADSVMENSRRPMTSSRSYEEEKPTGMNIMVMVRYIIKFVIFCLPIVFIVIAIPLFHHLYKNLPLSPPCAVYQTIDVTDIRTNLTDHVFGQNIAVAAVLSNLEIYNSAFQNDPSVSHTQQRPLVLSLHGWIGVGKTHMASIIAQSFPTHNVHNLIIPLHYPHAAESERYFKQLKDSIVNAITSCDRHLFVIDEVDKATWDVQSALYTVLKILRNADTPWNASVLVLLISNTGSNLINNVLLQHIELGQHRKSLSLQHIKEELLSVDDWHSTLYQAGLIDEVIPFLPLQRDQVKQCIRRDLEDKKEHYDETLVDEIASYMSYQPSSNPIFSTAGCRKVPVSVDIDIVLDASS